MIKKAPDKPDSIARVDYSAYVQFWNVMYTAILEAGNRKAKHHGLPDFWIPAKWHDEIIEKAWHRMKGTGQRT